MVPEGIKTLVLAQFSFLQVVWNRIGKLNLQLLQRRFTTGLQIQAVKRSQRECHAVVTHVICQCNKVKVVA